VPDVSLGGEGSGSRLTDVLVSRMLAGNGHSQT
jgi:hypothetical protein